MQDLTLEQFANASGSDSAEGIVFRQDSPVGLIYWTSWKVLIFCDFEMYHRLWDELLRTARLPLGNGRDRPDARVVEGEGV